MQTKACRSDIRRKKIIKSQVLDKTFKIKKRLLHVISFPHLFDMINTKAINILIL